jgi:hypothetical protein
VFLARGIVQLTLYGHDATGWLAFAKIAMGYPLYIAAVATGYWVIRRARSGLASTSADAGEPGDPGQDSADDALPDRRLGLG